MNLPKIENIDLSGKRIFVRLDLDVPLDKKDNSDGKFGYVIRDSSRLDTSRETINILLENGAKQVYLAGHIGRPDGEGKYISTFCLLKPLSEIYNKPVTFQPIMNENSSQENIDPMDGVTHQLVLLKNLRADSREMKNDSTFSRTLANLADLYVNESFAESHREAASIVGIPKYIPHAAGIHFVREVENLSRVFENPKKPVIVILGGAKEDKLSYIEGFKSFADTIHIVGALPKFMEESKDSKVVIANLLPDKEDITITSIERIEQDVAKAGTVILVGPIGKYEEEGHRLGTQRVFEALGKSSAFKVAGGGDTESAITLLGFAKAFSWISIGGGASLELLTKHTLPGIEALTTG
jgi:phosphoglycerate kinase